MVAETTEGVKGCNVIFETEKDGHFCAIVLSIETNGKIKCYTEYGWKYYLRQFIVDHSEKSEGCEKLLRELEVRGMKIVSAELMEVLNGKRIGFSESSAMGSGASDVLDETHPAQSTAWTPEGSA